MYHFRRFSKWSGSSPLSKWMCSSTKDASCPNLTTWKHLTTISQREVSTLTPRRSLFLFWKPSRPTTGTSSSTPLWLVTSTQSFTTKAFRNGWQRTPASYLCPRNVSRREAARRSNILLTSRKLRLLPRLKHKRSRLTTSRKKWKWGSIPWRESNGELKYPSTAQSRRITPTR